MRCKDKLNRIEFFYFFGGLNYPNGKRKSIKSQNVAEQIAERFIDKYFQLKEEERFAEQTIVKAFQSIYKNNDSSTRIKLGEKMFNGFKNKARDELDIQSINYYIQKYNNDCNGLLFLTLTKYFKQIYNDDRYKMLENICKSYYDLGLIVEYNLGTMMDYSIEAFTKFIVKYIIIMLQENNDALKKNEELLFSILSQLIGLFKVVFTQQKFQNCFQKFEFFFEKNTFQKYFPFSLMFLELSVRFTEEKDLSEKQYNKLIMPFLQEFKLDQENVLNFILLLDCFIIYLVRVFDYLTFDNQEIKEITKLLKNSSIILNTHLKEGISIENLIILQAMFNIRYCLCSLESKTEGKQKYISTSLDEIKCNHLSGCQSVAIFLLKQKDIILDILRTNLSL